MITAPDASGSPFFPDGRSMYERMLAGDPYLANDPEVGALSTRAQLLTERYNATSITEPDLRRTLLAELLGAVGEEIEIRPPFHVDYGAHVHIGERFFANFGFLALDCAEIRIGADVQVATNVQLLTATHPLEPGPRRDKWEAAAPITLGDNVWLGGGVIVGPGVSIGENTVVGAGSVVVKDLPANVVAVGTPARPVRSLPADPASGWDRSAVEDA
ncbi:sugar O-acetyltransferase [Citricoccus sp. I39-566]|uniref:sugar O-acetyltransferase n=1 Tax=Citricoccus sp. I39-566 TaxID=3073268 RepID=UPI002869EF3E|nr:sugar O-acetyltransferase [Citricoccus sp. I39-566]WMY78345.1 sugar O-acetyltransferase [Citricoccus sp. I39-566]